MGEVNVLKRCCYRSMKENRKRTAVTVIGILLATALITAVACMAMSLRASLIASDKQKDGDYHYCFVDVKQEYFKYFENNKYIEKSGRLESLGYAMLEGSRNPDKPYLYIGAIEEGMEDTLALQLAAGRMPENGSELVVGRHVGTNGGVAVQIGDMLTLQLGERMSEGYSLTQETPYLGEEERLETSQEKTYTVVGVIERPNVEVEPRIAPGYSAFTLLEEPNAAKKADVYVSYTKKGLRRADAVTAGILGVDEELYGRYYNGGVCTKQEEEQIRTVAKRVNENYWVLKWEFLNFSDRMFNILFAMSAIAILIIIVTSVFCIRNGFMISLTEKMKMYGRLASVGTTAGQQRKLVYYEAALLGMIGVPLGVLSGILATAILVELVGGLVADALGFGLMFAVSLPAILFGTLLSSVTVFLSAAGSAKRAARISPISAIRANDAVKTDWNFFGKGKMSERKLRCPTWIEKIFGIGGKIAYKNLRRARVKYRTTVVSIVVSVTVFIGMSTFMELLMLTSDVYSASIPYQVNVSIYQWDFYGQALAIARMDGVEEAEVVRSARFPVDMSNIVLSEEYKENYAESGYVPCMIRCLDGAAYERYCRKAGINPKEAKGKAIVLADYSHEYESDGKIYREEGDIASFQPGDILKGTDSAEGVEIEVLTQTTVKPMYMTGHAANTIILIVSEEWLDAQEGLGEKYDNIEVYIRCDDADAIEGAVRNDAQLQHYTVTNYDAVIRSEKSMHLVLAIFLYGFITVVALIGITNIFNTITTNMELRAPEFAMLRSVGMTGREFRRMIALEGIFYGGKSLFIGIPLGLLLSLCFHLALGEGIVTAFRFPWFGTISSAAAVGLLLFVIMHYSMGKINKKDIIETIRNENI